MEALQQVREFRKRSQLGCFSPPVMLATFAVELSLMVYTLWRYRLTRVSRLVTALFGLLAIFQLAEYMVCGGLGMSATMWARVGYVAITILPPLGVHLAFAIAGKTNRAVIGGLYALGAAFVAYFLLASDVFTGNQCLGNYVIFQLGTTASHWYGVYYYGLLLLAIGASLQFAASASKKDRRALHAFIAGYMLFMLPTTIVNTVSPETIAGIPSIMCGFAVLLALVVAFWVMPLVGQARGMARNKRHRSAR